MSSITDETSSLQSSSSLQNAKHKPNKASLRYVKQEEKYSQLSVYEDWPLSGIVAPHPENDVLFGRGGMTNHHIGNIRYRSWVDDKYRTMYEKCNTKTEKTNVAMLLIQDWRLRQNQGPPGRFLKYTETTGTWEDVGDRRAREKISQALRESKTLCLRGGRPGNSKKIKKNPSPASLSPRTRPPTFVTLIPKQCDDYDEDVQVLIEDQSIHTATPQGSKKRYLKKELLDRAKNLFLLSSVATSENSTQAENNTAQSWSASKGDNCSVTVSSTTNTTDDVQGAEISIQAVSIETESHRNSFANSEDNLVPSMKNVHVAKDDDHLSNCYVARDPTHRLHNGVKIFRPTLGVGSIERNNNGYFLDARDCIFPSRSLSFPVGSDYTALAWNNAPFFHFDQRR